ncbi:MAG: FAD/NAD(P)-binding protein [Acidimicrobiales bacterium]
MGAGLAGLVAARRLQDAGVPVVVLEAGPAPGGRLATRQHERRVLDHGAQFFTVRSDTFGEFVRRAARQGWPTSGAGASARSTTATAARCAGVWRRWARGWPTGSTCARPQRSRPSGRRTARRTVRRRGLVGGGSVTARSVLLTPPVPLSGLPCWRPAASPGPPWPAPSPTTGCWRCWCASTGPPGWRRPVGTSPRRPFSSSATTTRRASPEEVTVTFHTNRLSAQHWDDPDDELTAPAARLGGPWLAGATPLAVERDCAGRIPARCSPGRRRWPRCGRACCWPATPSPGPRWRGPTCRGGPPAPPCSSWPDHRRFDPASSGRQAPGTPRALRGPARAAGRHPASTVLRRRFDVDSAVSTGPGALLTDGGRHRRRGLAAALLVPGSCVWRPIPNQRRIEREGFECPTAPDGRTSSQRTGGAWTGRRVDGAAPGLRTARTK